MLVVPGIEMIVGDDLAVDYMPMGRMSRLIDRVAENTKGAQQRPEQADRLPAIQLWLPGATHRS